MKIVAIIPAYNEEKTIEEITKKTKKYCNNILVVCAKKCVDNTTKIVKSLGVDFIIDNGKGKGDAIRCAVNYLAKKENEKNTICVFIDADGSHNPKDISKLIKPIIKDNVDLVIGSRMLGGSEELYGSIKEFVRLFFNCIVTLIINYRFNVRLTDYQNGFRVVKLSVLKKLDLKSDITTIEQEMCIKALKKGFKIVEVPTHEYKRKYGKSSFSLWKVGHKYFFNLVRTLW